MNIVKLNEREDVKAILADDSLNKEMKMLKIRKEVLPKLDVLETKTIYEQNRVNNIYGKRKKIESDKMALLEFENLEQDFMLQISMMANIQYLLDRLSVYDTEKRYKKAIKKFINEIYGTTEAHMGTIKDLFNERAEHLKPCEIMELEEPFKTELQPSFEQLSNVYNFFKNNFEQLRIMTKAMFGSDPKYECVVYLHGLFTEEEMEKYRMKEFKNMSQEVFVIPVGETTLLQPFARNVEQEIPYDPTNKDVELMFINRNLRNDSTIRNLYERVKKAKKSDPDKVAKIKEYEKSLAKSDNINDEEEEKELKKKYDQEISNELSKLVNMDEDSKCTVAEVIDIRKKGEGSKYIPITEEEINRISMSDKGGN